MSARELKYWRLALCRWRQSIIWMIDADTAAFAALWYGSLIDME